MFRKLALALGATVAIASAALIPTSASAHMHGHGHWGHGWGYGIYAPTAYVASRSATNRADDGNNMTPASLRRSRGFVF